MRADCLRRGECDAVPLGQPDDLIALKQSYRRLGLSTEAVSAFQFELMAVKRAFAAANKHCWALSAPSPTHSGSCANQRTATTPSKPSWR